MGVGCEPALSSPAKLRVRLVLRAGNWAPQSARQSANNGRPRRAGGRCTIFAPNTPTGSARAFRCRSLPLAAAFFFATPVDHVTDIPRPYAHMQADKLADEITVCRECIQTTKDLRLRKQMQGKLAELIAEENRRFTEGLPF